jgi:hypothetical protein
MRLEVAFAEQDAVVVEGALEKEESGERLPSELCFGGEADPSTKLRAGAGPVQEEGTRGDQLPGGGAAMRAEMPGEPAVDGGHAAGEVELAVEVAGGAEGEGGWRLGVGGGQLAVEETGKILPGDAEGHLEEDALHEEAGIGMGYVAAVFSAGIQFVPEGRDALADEFPLWIGENGSASRTRVRDVPSARSKLAWATR